jgi:hypothetical protein
MITLIIIVGWLIGAIITCIASGYFDVGMYSRYDADNFKTFTIFITSILWPIVIPIVLIFVIVDLSTRLLLNIGDNLRRKK